MRILITVRDEVSSYDEEILHDADAAVEAIADSAVGVTCVEIQSGGYKVQLTREDMREIVNALFGV